MLYILKEFLKGKRHKIKKKPYKPKGELTIYLTFVIMSIHYVTMVIIAVVTQRIFNGKPSQLLDHFSPNSTFKKVLLVK